jgi:hypothetical protein
MYLPLLSLGRLQHDPYGDLSFWAKHLFRRQNKGLAQCNKSLDLGKANRAACQEASDVACEAKLIP